MNKATEVMMQYVENLKRTYEKDHAELMEFKKLASQNSSRCYVGSVDTGGKQKHWNHSWFLPQDMPAYVSSLTISYVFRTEDGVPRTSRSMSVQMGKVGKNLWLMTPQETCSYDAIGEPFFQKFFQIRGGRYDQNLISRYD